MLTSTHLVFGLFLGIVLESWVNPGGLYVYYSLIGLTSLLPDIDHEGSIVNKVLPITKVFAKVFKHRGFFHSIWPLVLLLFFAVPYSWNFTIAVIIGYGSHLLSDSFTKAGVNWIYPLSRFKVNGFLNTGGLVEKIIFVICVVGGFWFIFF